MKKSKKGSKDGSQTKRKKSSSDSSDLSSRSSSSSSSDSSSSGDESVPKKKEKKMKREMSDSDGKRFSLGDLRIKRRWQDADLSADAPKRPQFAKPPMFHHSQDGKPSYRQWTNILQHLLEYHIFTWRRDKVMNMTVGSFIKDTARDWFDVREEQMMKLWIVDNYKSFVESMDLRFKHNKEAQIATGKCRQVKYQSNILKYLDTLQQLNMNVGMSGVTGRERINEGITDFIYDLLPLIQGCDPEEDDPLILCIKELRLNYERRQVE